MTKRLQRFFPLRIVRRKVGEERNVIVSLHYFQERICRVAIQRLQCGLRERQARSIRAAVRLGERKLTLLSVLIEQHACCVFRLLHVRLVEGIDIEEQSGSCRRNFPAQELAAERFEVWHLE